MVKLKKSHAEGSQSPYPGVSYTSTRSCPIAEYGLFLEVYLNNYSDDLIKKDPLFISCVNTIRLLFSRVYNGADRNLALAEIQSRQPITISRG